MRRIPKGERGEQGDAVMPFVVVGQHSALEEGSAQLLPRKHLFAFHDDICLLTMPEFVVFGVLCLNPESTGRGVEGPTFQAINEGSRCWEHRSVI